VGGTVVLVIVLDAGVAGAAYSNRAPSETNSFATGTVTEGSGGLTSACVLSGIYPGEPVGICKLQVSYAGSLPVYIGLDVAITTASGVGGSVLYNSNATGLTFTLSDGTTSYNLPSGAQVLDELAASSYPSGVPDAVFTSAAGQNSVTFTLTPTFATGQSSPDQYEGASASVTLTAHAVQSAHNALPAACTSGGHPIIGASCTGLSWS
jgi:hypothetical protein